LRQGGKRRRSSSLATSGGYYGKCKRDVLSHCNQVQIVPCDFNDPAGDDSVSTLRDVLVDEIKLCPPGITDRERRGFEINAVNITLPKTDFLPTDFLPTF